MHASKTTADSLISVAETYHASCVRLLIDLGEEDVLVYEGVALVATCLLRSFEILSGEFMFTLHFKVLAATLPPSTNFLLPSRYQGVANLLLIWFLIGEVDPNIHLHGAYSMASAQKTIPQSPNKIFINSGFWNYLREDITFSLYKQCPLKMKLGSQQTVPLHESDPDYLNSITIILGRIINIAFSDERIVESQWIEPIEALRVWFEEYPKRMLPFSKTYADGSSFSPFPEIWFIQPCHGKRIPR
jgi:hypothetical protein